MYLDKYTVYFSSILPLITEATRIHSLTLLQILPRLHQLQLFTCSCYRILISDHKIQYLNSEHLDILLRVTWKVFPC